MLPRMKGLTAVMIYSFWCLSCFKATQGSWRGASTSTSQSLVENIATHASENHQNSYVSFQQNQVHVCGGVRMTVDQALTIEECFIKILEYHREIYAVTLIPDVEPYGIQKFKKVNSKLSILMLKVPEKDKGTYQIPNMPLIKCQPDKHQGGTVVLWDEGYIGDLLFQNLHLAGIVVQRREKASLGGSDEASGSTSQSATENEATHVNEGNINSYVSFQNNERHICGGYRATADQVVTVKICFHNIREHYSEISAVIMGLTDKAYPIKQYKEVKNGKLFIIVLQVPEIDRQNYVSTTPLLAVKPVVSIGATLVGWNQASPKPTVRFAEKCTISKYTTSEILVSNFMITGTLPFHEGFVGNLLFQNFNLIGIAKELTGEPESDSLTFTTFHEIYENANNIQNALNTRKTAREFDRGQSLWQTITNIGSCSSRGYTKLS